MEVKKLTISEIHQQTPHFKTFVFKDGHGISYKSGQFLTFIHNTGFEEIRRSYSITSSPDLNEPLTIGVQRIQNGVLSRALVDKAKVGDQILCTGAGGFFVLPENADDYKQLFFFAAGSGITSIFSLLKTAITAHRHLHIVLVYSSRKASEIIFRKELDELRLRFPQRFAIEYFSSDEKHLRRARLTRERTQHLVKEHSITDYSQTLFYICGPESYMRMCTYALQEMSVSQQNIRRENFAIERKAVPKTLPPDTEPHGVKIINGESEVLLHVAYPETILQAAKKAGLKMAFSCETGRCGSCVAKCKSGQVWMSYNEVLTDKELVNGLVLTCTGHPVFGDVVLEV